MADEIEPIEPPERHEDDYDDDPLPPEFEGQDGASVPGVPFAYDLTRDEIIRQEASIREVNSRLGFLLAASLTFATFFFKDVTNPILQLVGSLALIVVLILLLFGYVPRAYLRAPNPVAIVEDAGNRPGRMKENALATMIEAFNLNNEVIATKNRFYAWALRIGGTLVILGLLFEAFDGGQALWAALHHESSRSSANPHPLIHAEMRPRPTPH